MSTSSAWGAGRGLPSREATPFPPAAVKTKPPSRPRRPVPCKSAASRERPSGRRGPVGGEAGRACTAQSQCSFLPEKQRSSTASWDPEGLSRREAWQVSVLITGTSPASWLWSSVARGPVAWPATCVDSHQGFPSPASKQNCQKAENLPLSSAAHSWGQGVEAQCPGQSRQALRRQAPWGAESGRTPCPGGKPCGRAVMARYTAPRAGAPLHSGVILQAVTDGSPQPPCPSPSTGH